MSEDDPMEDVINEDDSEMVTVWAPEPSNDSDELLSSSIDQWINDVKFETTEDVPIPERLVDQVIGQEAGSVVIRKAAEQRRHMLMIGDPGTGKSMLARSMTDSCRKTHSRMYSSIQTKMMRMNLVFARYLLDVQNALYVFRRKPFVSRKRRLSECC